MYKIGDLVIYGSEGVCKVVDVGVPKISSFSTDKTYYTLEPLYRDGLVYAPVDTNITMRLIVTFDEAQQIINQIPAIGINPCEEKSMRLLSEHYESALRSYECKNLIQLIKTVYMKKEDLLEQGKKLGQIDLRYMKTAEDMLYGELAVALNIPKDDVKDYIANKVEGKEKQLA